MCIRDRIRSGVIESAHDVADGGLFITLLSKEYTADNEYAKFFTDIESKIDSVKRIEIETRENAVYLFNNNGKWKIPRYENYPASEEKIKKDCLPIYETFLT